MASKHRVTINLDGEEFDALQRIAAGNDRSLAWVGRRAISDFIQQRGQKMVPLDPSDSTMRAAR